MRGGPLSCGWRVGDGDADLSSMLLYCFFLLLACVIVVVIVQFRSWNAESVWSLTVAWIRSLLEIHSVYASVCVRFWIWMTMGGFFGRRVQGVRGGRPLDCGGASQGLVYFLAEASPTS